MSKTKRQVSPSFPEPRLWQIAYPSGKSASIYGLLQMHWIEGVGASPVIEAGENCTGFDQVFEKGAFVYLDPRADIRRRERRTTVRVYNPRRYYDLLDTPFQEWLVANPGWPTVRVDREEDAFPNKDVS